MAATGFYNHDNSYSHSDNYDRCDGGYSATHRREDAPLPSLPHHQPTSPFDDQTYPYQLPAHPDTSYYGSHDDRDPYDDHDAVPMHNYNYKHSSQASTAPVIAPEYDDPFVRNARPKKKKTTNMFSRGLGPDGRKNGWFSGQITWVCYILSAIQLIVFIAQIIRNGSIPSPPFEPILRSTRT